MKSLLYLYLQNVHFSPFLCHSCPFLWIPAHSCGFRCHSCRLLRIPVEWVHSCRNQWGMMKYCIPPSNDELEKENKKERDNYTREGTRRHWMEPRASILSIQDWTSSGLTRSTHCEAFCEDEGRTWFRSNDCRENGCSWARNALLYNLWRKNEKLTMWGWIISKSFDMLSSRQSMNESSEKRARAAWYAARVWTKPPKRTCQLSML